MLKTLRLTLCTEVSTYLQKAERLVFFYLVWAQKSHFCAPTRVRRSKSPMTALIFLRRAVNLCLRNQCFVQTCARKFRVFNSLLDKPSFLVRAQKPRVFKYRRPIASCKSFQLQRADCPGNLLCTDASPPVKIADDGAHLPFVVP